jgi:hypothetical protein
VATYVPGIEHWRLVPSVLWLGASDAALGRYEDTPWVASFLTRLLEGSPPVLQRLGENPFPDHAPRYVRAVLYDYRFTTAAERATTGAWWTRRLVGPYSPVLSLEW